MSGGGLEGGEEQFTAALVGNDHVHHHGIEHEQLKGKIEPWDLDNHRDKHGYDAGVER